MQGRIRQTLTRAVLLIDSRNLGSLISLPFLVRPEKSFYDPSTVGRGEAQAVDSPSGNSVCSGDAGNAIAHFSRLRLCRSDHGH